MMKAASFLSGRAMTRISRRNFMQFGAGIAGAFVIPSWAWAVKDIKLARYVQRVPVPGAGIVVATPSTPNTYSFTQTQISRQLHPDLPPTPIWAYDDGSGLAGQAGSFGMALVAQTGTPVNVSFRHALPETYPSWIPVDTRLTPLGSQVRLMTHLHGGFVAADSDGNPAVTPNGFGPGETQNVFYTNQAPQMRASLLWFHDHGLGTTRLNVFAGLAAAYILRDSFDTGDEGNPIGLPGGAYEIPLVIQDRQFNADGTLLYPTSDIPGATWIGEYFGNVMLVNGKVWPFLDVEPRMYRFRILNGCNARILSLDIGGPDIWQIGAEGGMFDVPVRVKELVLAPAERADILVDFSGFAGATLLIRNRTPRKPVSTPAPPLTQVMQMRVGISTNRPGPTIIPPTLLGGSRADLAEPVATRYITLNEIDPDEEQWRLNLNAMSFEQHPVTESPKAGTIEDWVYINMTADTHPMHTHLVTFQVIGRTPFDVDAYEDAYGGPNGVPGGIDPRPFATGSMFPPAPEERGFKDTVKANPGYFTTIRAKFDLPMGVSAPQNYVHHCHIVEHEDNDMMRPFSVI
jgi:spore coat protein A, manganese oxidase